VSCSDGPMEGREVLGEVQLMLALHHEAGWRRADQACLGNLLKSWHFGAMGGSTSRRLSSMPLKFMAKDAYSPE
jgi:hypothetical protein